MEDKIMTHVYVKYNPYRMETQINVNGKKIEEDSILYKVVRGKRLQEWVGKFPEMLVEELNTVDFEIEFHGMPLDWDDFEDAFTQAKQALLITSYGACIFCTAIPLSITFISRLANIYAIVPPPPISTFPSSAVWNATSASSITFLNFPTNSADASLEPLLPLAPVYLLNTIPFPKYAAFFFSNTDA